MRRAAAKVHEAVGAKLCAIGGHKVKPGVRMKRAYTWDDETLVGICSHCAVDMGLA